MSEFEEKRHPPTASRIAELREEGITPYSALACSAMALAICVYTLALLVPNVTDELSLLSQNSWRLNISNYGTPLNDTLPNYKMPNYKMPDDKLLSSASSLLQKGVLLLFVSAVAFLVLGLAQRRIMFRLALCGAHLNRLLAFPKLNHRTVALYIAGCCSMMILITFLATSLITDTMFFSNLLTSTAMSVSLVEIMQHGEINGFDISNVRFASLGKMIGYFQSHFAIFSTTICILLIIITLASVIFSRLMFNFAYRMSRSEILSELSENETKSKIAQSFHETTE